MFRPFQLYARFSIENNRVNFYGNKIFPIDSMLTGHDQESVVLSEM